MLAEQKWLIIEMKFNNIFEVVVPIKMFVLFSIVQPEMLIGEVIVSNKVLTAEFWAKIQFMSEIWSDYSQCRFFWNHEKTT